MKHLTIIILFNFLYFCYGKDSATPYSFVTFYSEVGRTNHFINFYAPWCRYSKKLYPVWEKLAEIYNDNGDIIISKVDCETDKSLCDENDIIGYPTQKFFKAGQSKGVEYNGGIDLKSLTAFVESQQPRKYSLNL